MKEQITAALLACMATFVFGSAVTAQRTQTAGDFVTVDNASVPVIQVFLLDSITSDNNLVYLASFELELGSNESKQIISALLSPQPLNQLAIRTQSSERIYRSVTVRQLIFPELNARSADAARLKVIIQAQQVTAETSGSSFTNYMKFVSPAMRNSFRLSLGALPSKRVSRISHLSLTASHGEPVWFSVDIHSPDDAKAWRDWLYARDTYSSQDATITLLDRSLINPLLSLQLSGVQIVSVSMTGSREAGLPGTTTIGLRAQGVSIDK